MNFSLGSYVDLDGGTCTLDSPDFAALLEACKALRPKSTPVFWAATITACFISFPCRTFAYTIPSVSKAGASWASPTDEGNGCTLRPLLRVAVGATTDKLEGMEAFLDYLLFPRRASAL